MSYVNPDALNVLTREQAEEAARLIDIIGFSADRIRDKDTANELCIARNQLKALFADINNDRYPVII